MESNKYLSHCEKTEIGLKRKNNEDAYMIVNKERYHEDYGTLFAIADGMGGHAYGEIASKIACEALLEYFETKTHKGDGSDQYKDRLHFLEQTVLHANDRILNECKNNQKYEGMGTTLSVLVLYRGKSLIAHVGDSRIYRLRKGNLKPMTVDQNMAQFLIDEGELSPSEAIIHPSRHMLTQVMGAEIDNIFTRIDSLQSGDLFLLCSDGLHDMVTDSELFKILLSENKNEICDRLTDAALKNGGKDNITIIVVYIKRN